MKKLMLVVLAVAMLSALMVATAVAEQTFSVENGTLVVKEVEAKETMRVSGVPGGVLAEDAHRLVTGKVASVTVKGEEAKKEFSFGWPMTAKETFSDTIVGYGEAGFRKKVVLRTERKNDWFLTIVWLVIPAIGVLVVSLINQLSGSGHRKLYVFYIAMFAGIFVGALTGWLAGGLAGMFAGAFAGAFAGGLAGMFAGGNLVSRLAGMFAGALAGVFAGEQGIDIVIFYCLFFVCAVLYSYVIALAGVVTKRHWPAIKEWVTAK